MALKIVRYRDQQSLRWGQLIGDPPAHSADQVQIVPIDKFALTTSDIVGLHAARTLDYPSGHMITVMAENLLSPITGDGRIICQGLNYSEHATEAQHHVRRQNLIFMKASSALTGPYAPIFRPGEVELLDYEVEIGLVLRSALGQDTDVTDENIGTY